MSEAEERPVEIVNDGEGVSVSQAAEMLADSGLAEAIEEVTAGENEGERTSDSQAQKRFVEAQQRLQSSQEPSPVSTPQQQPVQPQAAQQQPVQSQAAQQQPVQQQPQPQQVAPLQAIQQLNQARAQATSELQALTANRQALTEQFGPAEVIARETTLRGHLSEMDKAAVVIAGHLKEQQQAAAQRVEAEQQRARAQLRDELGLSSEEYRSLAAEASKELRDLGVTEDELRNINDPRLAKLLLQRTKERRELNVSKSELRKAARTVAKTKRMARSNKQTPSYSPHGSFTPGDGSLADAADVFQRMGIL